MNENSTASTLRRHEKYDRLIAAADHALYDAKKAGRNGFATYDPAPPLVPDPETRGLSDMGLRKRA